MRYVLTLAAILSLFTSQAFAKASIVPAFSKFSSAGMSVDAGKQGTNTMQVIGATFSKPGGKPTMTIGDDVRIHYLLSDGTDYGPALLRALASGNKHVTFPSGTFDVSPVYKTGISNVTISGQGRSTVIRPKWDGTLPYASTHLVQFTNCSNITFRDLTFDGRVSEGLLDAHPNGLWFFSCDSVTLERTHHYDMAYQDRSPAMFYDCTNTQILNNRFIGTDVVSFVNSGAGRNFVLGNTFDGSYSEGFSIQNDQADIVPYAATTAPRSTIIAHNIVSDHKAAAFSVINSINAGVVISDNIIQAKTGNNMGSILLQGFSSYGGGIMGAVSGVTISGNTFSGPIQGIKAYGQVDGIKISDNTFSHTLSIFVQGSGTYGSGTETLTGISITGNTYVGPVNLPAYDAAKSYFAGEMVQSSGAYYQSIVDGNVGNAVGNTAYWITPTQGTYTQSIIKFNGSRARVDGNDIKDAVRNVVDTGISSGPYSIKHNSITNSGVPLYIAPGPSTTPTVTYGAELAVAGDMSDTSKWNKPAGLVISDGVATGTAVNGTMYSAINFATAGRLYSVTFTISSISSGGVYPRACATLGTLRTAPGTYTEIIAASGEGNALGITTDTNSTFVLDDLSIKEVTYSSGSIDGLEVTGNTTTGTFNGSAGVVISAGKITNSKIKDNNFYSTSFADAFSSSVTLIENSVIANNIFRGGTTYSFAEYGIGTWSKTGNDFEYPPNAARHFDIPVVGLVRVGTIYDVLAPAAGGYRQNICITTGHAYKESYNTGNAYLVGENVLGSDGNVYVCILADSGSSTNAPTTGASWATYWRYLGTPTVFKGYGSIAP